MEYEFKNGETYELDKAGRGNILVFRDAIFESKFDRDCDNDWEESSLKKELEEWWEENAPEELKAKYEVSILSAEEVYDQETLDRYFGKGKAKSIQLPLFKKDWKAKIKRLVGESTSYWWWLKNKSPWYSHDAAYVHTDGSLGNYGAYNANGCVPACYPRKLATSPSPSAFSGGGKGK